MMKVTIEAWALYNNGILYFERDVALPVVFEGLGLRGLLSWAPGVRVEEVSCDAGDGSLRAKTGLRVRTDEGTTRDELIDLFVPEGWSVARDHSSPKFNRMMMDHQEVDLAGRWYVDLRRGHAPVA